MTERICRIFRRHPAAFRIEDKRCQTISSVPSFRESTDAKERKRKEAAAVPSRELPRGKSLLLSVGRHSSHWLVPEVPDVKHLKISDFGFQNPLSRPERPKACGIEGIHPKSLILSSFRGRLWNASLRSSFNKSAASLKFPPTVRRPEKNFGNLWLRFSALLSFFHLLPKFPAARDDSADSDSCGHL